MKIKNHLLVTVFVLSAAFLSMAFMSAATELEVADAPSVQLEDGQEIYMTRCLSCHMTNGEGVPGVFPPLANSEHVTGDKGVLIRMILQGLSGEIVVNGTTYSGMMPPWGGFLNDEQVAQVLTYVRSNFGNEADAVTTEEVASIRELTKDRKEVWTMEDLNQEANRGIPGGE